MRWWAVAALNVLQYNPRMQLPESVAKSRTDSYEITDPRLVPWRSDDRPGHPPTLIDRYWAA